MRETANTERLLKVRDVLDQLNISRRTLYRIIARKELAVVHAGRAVRIPASSVHRWIQAHQFEDINA